MHFSQLPEALSARFGASVPDVPDRRRKNAAVALILRPPPGFGDPLVGDADVLMIRRAVSRRDPWSGQMALPGGRLDKSDSTLVAAAVRETQEETAVTLNARRDLVGSFPTLRPVSVHIPSVTVWPYVFSTAPEAKAKTASREVASVHWFPLKAMADPANQSEFRIQVPGEAGSFPCIRVNDQVVWGLTYRILSRLLDIL